MTTTVLPVKNEPALQKFLDQLHNVLTEEDIDFEILVIMGDRETLHPQLTVPNNIKTYTSYADSLERAILLGISCASGDKIIVMDADGSHPIREVPTMLKLLDTHDMVVGSRFLEGSYFEQTAFRKFVSSCYIWLARQMGSKLSDPMSGFFAFNKSLIDQTQFLPVAWKTCLEIEIKSKPSKIAEVAIHFGKREAGISKTSAKVGLQLIYDMLRMWLS